MNLSMSDECLKERISLLRGRLVASAFIASFEVMNELVVQGIGLYRVHARLVNGDELFLLERCEWMDGRIKVGKYAFHWQRSDGALVRRWDNAPHHRNIPTFPDHFHEGSEDNALPHEAVDMFSVLRMLEYSFDGGICL